MLFFLLEAFYIPLCLVKSFLHFFKLFFVVAVLTFEVLLRSAFFRGPFTFPLLPQVLRAFKYFHQLFVRIFLLSKLFLIKFFFLKLRFLPPIL